MPRQGLLSVTCLDLTADSCDMGEKPEFSASAMGMSSRASAKARRAYCSVPVTESANLEMALEQAISAEPPPYTMRLFLMRFLTTHMASWSDRFASSTIMLLPPRTRIVTAFEFSQSSITSILQQSV
jgi:hypothetical protein